MKTLKELRERRATLVEELRTMLDAMQAAGTDPTQDEDYKAKRAEFEALKGQIEAREALEAEQRQIEAEQRELGKPATEPEGPAIEGRAGVRVGEERELNQPFVTIGEQMHAIARAQDPGYTGPDKLDKRLLKLNDEQRAATGMSEGVPSDGGFAVQKDFVEQIITKTWDQGSLLSRVTNIPLGPGKNGVKLNVVDESSRADGSRWGGVLAYWANEADTVTSTKPKLRGMELSLQKLFALVYSTDELQEDAPALTALVDQIVPQELRFKAEDGIVNGTGAGQLLGFMNSGAVISVAKEASQAADTVLLQNISKMKARFWTRSRASTKAAWLINQDVEPQLEQLFMPVKNVAGSENVGGFNPGIYIPAGARGNQYAMLSNFPVLPVEYAATVGDLGDIALVDLAEYLTIQRQARSDASMHVRFLYDEMTYRFIWRLDGQPAWNKAVTPKNGSNTLSPFVALAARA